MMLVNDNGSAETMKKMLYQMVEQKTYLGHSSKDIF